MSDGITEAWKISDMLKRRRQAAYILSEDKDDIFMSLNEEKKLLENIIKYHKNRLSEIDEKLDNYLDDVLVGLSDEDIERIPKFLR